MTLVPASNRNGIAVLCVVSIFGALATTAVVLRVWARKLKRMPLAWNDYFCILALLFMLALIASTVCTVIWGIGIPAAELLSQDPGQPVRLYKNLFTCQLLWIVSNICVRISVILLYTTIFPVKLFRQICYGVLGINLAYALAVILETFLICQPLDFNWNQTIPGSHCGDQLTAYIAIGSINIILDAILVCLPLPLIWNLKMGRSKKVALSVVLGMGIVICIVSTVRVQQLATLDPSNLSEGYARISILSDLEPLLGIINACLPVLRPVFLVLFPGKMSTVHTGYNLKARSESATHQGMHNSKYMNLGKDDYDSREYHLPAQISTASNEGLIEPSQIYVRNEWTVQSSDY